MTGAPGHETPEDQLKAIGAAIGRLAARNRGSAALGRLAEELSSAGPALIGTDLITAFPPATLLPDVTVHGYGGVRRLELFRDLLVFFPVLVTWWELRLALVAYNKSVVAAASRHTTAVSFLLGWQRGFNKQTLSLSQTALIVVAIIALVIGCTAVAHFWSNRVDAANSRASQRDRLGGLLAEGTLLLTKIGQPGTDSFKRADLSKIVRAFYDTTGQLTVALQATAQQVEDSGNQIVSALQTGPGARLAKALDDWSDTARALRDLGQSLTMPTEVLAKLAELQRLVDASALRMESGIQGLIAQLGDHTRAAGEEAAAHALMAGNVSAATHEVRNALDTLATRLERLGALVEEFDRTRLAGSEDWLA
jgi:hypothetical protein